MVLYNFVVVVVLIVAHIDEVNKEKHYSSFDLSNAIFIKVFRFYMLSVKGF